MIKTWLVTAELDMCAENYKTVTVKANTELKARKFATAKFVNEFHAFHITNMTVKELSEQKK